MTLSNCDTFPHCETFQFCIKHDSEFNAYFAICFSVGKKGKTQLRSSFLKHTWMLHLYKNDLGLKPHCSRHLLWWLGVLESSNNLKTDNSKPLFWYREKHIYSIWKIFMKYLQIVSSLWTFRLARSVKWVYTGWGKSLWS